MTGDGGHSCSGAPRLGEAMKGAPRPEALLRSKSLEGRSSRGGRRPAPPTMRSGSSFEAASRLLRTTTVVLARLLHRLRRRLPQCNIIPSPTDAPMAFETAQQDLPRDPETTTRMCRFATTSACSAASSATPCATRRARRPTPSSSRSARPRSASTAATRPARGASSRRSSTASTPTRRSRSCAPSAISPTSPTSPKISITSAATARMRSRAPRRGRARSPAPSSARSRWASSRRLWRNSSTMRW